MLSTNRQVTTCGIFIFSLVIGGCSDTPTQPTSFSPIKAVYSAGSATSCARTGAVIVSDEGALRAALAAAQPGTVVAIHGTITVAGADEIEVPEGVTLTCAEPGAGVRSATYRYTLLSVYSPNVSVTGLTIDGTNGDWPIFVLNGYLRTDVSDVTLDGNSVICGTGCVFIVGASSTNVINNFVKAGQGTFTGTGIHLQGNGVAMRVDSSRIENNVITTLAPSGIPQFGAIRPRDGTHVIIRGNTITGPWSNGVAIANLREGVLERNTIDGTTRFGFFLGAGFSNSPISVTGSLFRANDVTSAGGPALWIQRACFNVFVGNRLAAPAATPTVVFTANTGANVLLGPPAIVEDNGNFDCDGDGVVDPNITTGKTHKGGYVGEIIAPVMQMAGRIQIN